MGGFGRKSSTVNEGVLKPEIFLVNFVEFSIRHYFINFINRLICSGFIFDTILGVYAFP